MQHALAKHIQIKYLFVQQLVQANIISVAKIRSNDNRADVFTKHVTPETFRRHLQAIGLIDSLTETTTHTMEKLAVSQQQSST